MGAITIGLICSDQVSKGVFCKVYALEFPRYLPESQCDHNNQIWYPSVYALEVPGYLPEHDPSQPNFGSRVSQGIYFEPY